MTRKFEMLVLMLYGLSGCQRPVDPPTVRACVALLSPLAPAPEAPLRTCLCADGIARRQLDPEAYRLVSELAEATIADRTVAQKGASAGSAVMAFRRRVGPVNSVIAVVDFSTLTAKSVSRCR